MVWILTDVGELFCSVSLVISMDKVEQCTSSSTLIYSCQVSKYVYC